MSERYRIGVDIGGTFTDLVMLDTGTGRLYNDKVLTTPRDPSVGVLEGIGRILAANGVSASEVEHVIHGTTLVANAVIEGRNRVVVSAATVARPTAVRYGFANYTVVNLWNKEGLPAAPFRTDMPR